VRGPPEDGEELVRSSVDLKTARRADAGPDRGPDGATGYDSVDVTVQRA
jgi:hypothetical protein